MKRQSIPPCDECGGELYIKFDIDVDNYYFECAGCRKGFGRVTEFMKLNDKDHLLFIEPETPCSEQPTIDELTAKMQTLLDACTFPDYAYKGFHTCFCGINSDNRDWILPNGMITNSLAVHYLRWHRAAVPKREIEKLKAIKI